MDNNNIGYPYYPNSVNTNTYPQRSNTYIATNPNVYPQQPPQPQPVQIPPRILDYVQGELGATIYPVAFNQEVVLIDMDDPSRMYKKSRDASGKLNPIEKFRIIPDEEKKQEEVNMSEYVKVDEILDIVAEAVQSEVQKRLSEISFKPASTDKERK